MSSIDDSGLNFDDNTKFVLKQMMRVLKCNNLQEFSQRVTVGFNNMTINEINLKEFEKSMLETLDNSKTIQSLRTYSNSIGDNMLFALLIKIGHIKRFCDIDCDHSTNDCVAPEFLNQLVVVSPNEWQTFFEKQTKRVKQRSMSLLSIDIIQNTCIQAFQVLKPYLTCAKINTLPWLLLQKFKENIDLKDQTDKIDKLLFFVAFIDDYGDHVNIFETFFDAPPHPGWPGGDFTNEQLRARLQNRWKFIQAERLKAKNYKTIVEFADEYLNDQCIVVGALKNRLDQIIKFRNATVQ